MTRPKFEASPKTQEQQISTHTPIKCGPPVSGGKNSSGDKGLKSFPLTVVYFPFGTPTRSIWKAKVLKARSSRDLEQEHM